MPEQDVRRSCADCGTLHCAYHDRSYPPFCPTAAMGDHERAELLAAYLDPEERRMAVAASEIEVAFYGEYTRIEEIMEFARRVGAEKIGVAACAALAEEAKLFTSILRVHGFQVFCVSCKVGALLKRELGVGQTYLREPEERACDPIGQAELLAREGTQLNVVLGLCVGHDSLFYRHSQAPVTTLIAKDRVAGNDPAGVLYTVHSFYSRLLEP